MRKLDASMVTRRLVGIQHKTFAVLELDRAFGERSHAELRPLKIDQNADRPAVATLDIANGLDQLAHLVVRGMAHIDAEDVGAGFEQAPDHRSIRRYRAERCKNLDAAQTSHGLLPGAGGRPDAPGGVPPGEFGIPGRFPGPPGPIVPGIPGTRCAGWSLDSVSCT